MPLLVCLFRPSPFHAKDDLAIGKPAADLPFGQFGIVEQVAPSVVHFPFVLPRFYFR